jgi:hypothetical protein
MVEARWEELCDDLGPARIVLLTEPAAGLPFSGGGKAGICADPAVGRATNSGWCGPSPGRSPP